jgi:hypothetical protein
MEFWLFILYIIICAVGVVTAIGIAVFLIKANRRLERIYREKNQDNVEIHEKCMIRDGILHSKCVAQVIGNDLILYTLLGKYFKIPLADIRVKKEFISHGWYAWFGKTVFYLDTPYTWRLAIAVSSPERWRAIFDKKVTAFQNREKRKE